LIQERRKMKTINIKKLVMGLMTVLFCLGPALADAPKVSPMAFNQDMRKLWEDHITWTRLYIVNALADLPSKEATADRLLANQVDIGNLIKPFYGDGAGNKLSALLKDHILIAAEVVDAAKAGDRDKQNEASKRWYANSNDIAVFLDFLNPKNWPYAEMKPMMYQHLDTTTEEVTARLNQDWTGDVASYDKLHLEILKMADMLSSGIVKQFPDRFEK
jgi:hypothetical protein